MTGWLLQSLEIEGFRGINNEGDPLVLKFAVDAVNSISAPNGVGKSSIFDALTFVLRGRIPKLDSLPAAERGSDYYLNRFHSGGMGTVKLTLLPDGGGSTVVLTATRQKDGTRKLSATGSTDANALAATLNRDFVLLDHKTFQDFIDDKALERGRSFSGLLGLTRYSVLRQELQGLANTKAFSNHFGFTTMEQWRTAALRRITQAETALRADFQSLTGEDLADQADTKIAQARAHSALAQIAILTQHCSGKAFDQISIDECVESVGLTEVGDDKKRLADLLREEAEWKTRQTDTLTDEAFESLRALASASDKALKDTAGPLLLELFKIGERIVADDEWVNKSLCPACDHVADESVLDHLRSKLSHYQAVQAAAQEIAAEWESKGWNGVSALETAAREQGEPAIFAEAAQGLQTKSLTATDVEALWKWRKELHNRAERKVQTLDVEKGALELKLPPSLVAVTTKLETARRLQKSWVELTNASADVAKFDAENTRISRIRCFLDVASSRFATAESNASTRRVAAVEPLCRELFSHIMHEPVVPALIKRDGSEELSLGLSEFWMLRDVSAQALLCESFRNAFAVSVYLAAAMLYGGSPRFVVLDDVTSSFDAGHQFHLMEVIRTRFARPARADGLQVVLLSHDTLLEKLFNKNGNTTGWSHQRLEGTARTAILPQSNAVNRVRDRTIAFLNAGQVDDAAPRLRQYLEYKLLDIIGRVRIPVPVDFALDDQKKQVQSCLDAITDAVNLHKSAGTLILEPVQLAGLAPNVATITGNFLAHYATGSTGAFSAASLLGVIKAIDDYANCFMFEHPPGSGQRRYYKSLSKRI